MAGDWIKMRVDLLTHPKLVRILSATHADKFRVLGGLFAVWSIFDAHSEDGKLKGYTPETMDHVIGWDGFSRALEAVGWLTFDGLETLGMPEFEEHNGKSGKRRAEDKKRKKESRNSVRNVSAECPQKSVTREEKRREEINTLSSGDDGSRKEGQESRAEQQRLIPVDAILAAYHDSLPMLPAVRKMTDPRKRKLKARWTEEYERQTVEYWRKFFAYAATSDFLTGRNGQWTGCDFEWLIESSNHVKVIEGKYENRETA